MIGAGGIGAEIVAQLLFRDFRRAGTVLLLTVVVVLAVDLISARVRRRIITGRAERGLLQALRSMNWWRRVLMVAVAVAAISALAFVLFQFQQALVA
jgi:hypothetical protein